MRRLRLLVGVSLSGALIGIAYGGITGLVFRLPALPRSVVGAVDGAAIATPIAAIEIFLLRSRWGRPLQQAPFLVTFGAKWLIYAMMITTVVVGGPGARMLGLPPSATPLENPLVRLALVFSVVATFVFLVVFELRQIVGPRNLRNIVLGRYHKPRIEERFFLFIDVAGSTSLAERLGPSAVHHFLAKVFSLASDPIDDHAGEIYQYVGDEIVVTWTLGEARGGARPVSCFFAIVAALEAAAPAFEGEFGVAPRVRAALHAGQVISGEIGDSKRDIVFHGDVMNTAARLEQATRDLDRPFLASADAVKRLSVTEPYELKPLGPQVLRGRAAPVEVYAVRPAH
jgi:adenylate cyclase